MELLMLGGIFWKLLVWMLNWGVVAVLLAFYITGIFS